MTRDTPNPAGAHRDTRSAEPVLELPPRAAHERVLAGARLIDIREPGEQATGMAEGAVAVARRDLEQAPEHWLDGTGPVVLICARGRRSLDCARILRGHHWVGERIELISVAGGTDAWRAEGLPMTAATVTARFAERYDRHLRLPDVGLAGQQRLAAARVVLIGAGGLGSPAAFYLAAAGIGRLRIVDGDRIERSNLQRQILHRDDAIGRLKVESAAAAVSGLNPDIQVEPVPVRLASDNVEAVLADADVVIDGSDNFATRYLLSDACVRLGKPLVYGAVERFQGQVSVFDAGRARGQAPCYRCLFPQPPAPEFAPNCAEAGVLGIVPGVIGLLQATEAIKLILHLGDSLSGRLLHFDARAMRFRETRLAADPDCPVCPPGTPFSGYAESLTVCASADQG